MGRSFLIFNLSGPTGIDSWTGDTHELRSWQPEFDSPNLSKRRYPTHSTMHGFGNRIFYFASASPSIGCYDLETKTASMVDVPVQLLEHGAIWDVENLEFDEAVVNSKVKLFTADPPRADEGHTGEDSDT